MAFTVSPIPTQIPRDTSSLSLTALMHRLRLICGILSIICCCFGIIGIILGAVGLVLAIIGNKDHKHGVGTGGLACSIIGLVLSLVILGMALLGSYSMPRDVNDLYEYMEMYER